MKKVTGIGGIFFKSKDPESLKAWYQKHLGFSTDPYGVKFDWKEEGEAAAVELEPLRQIAQADEGAAQPAGRARLGPLWGPKGDRWTPNREFVMSF